MIVWQRLIRFVATDGRTLRGEPVLPSPDFDLGTTTAETKLQAKVITGHDLYDTTGATNVTDEVVTVKELLGPLTKSDVPILRCVGLNYAKHSELPVFQFDNVQVAHGKSSQGSGPLASSIPIHLLQAHAVHHGPRRRCSHPEDLSG